MPQARFSSSSFSVSVQAIGLACWLLLTFLAAAIGAVASIRAADFYGQLARPDWAPPSAVFSPVWTALYVCMALAAWLVWRRGGFIRARQALILFMVQLALNALWSWPFFIWRIGALAMVNIALLWIAIAMTISAFWKISRTAGTLMLPYLGWVGFAAALNYSIWRLNPQLL